MATKEKKEQDSEDIFLQDLLSKNRFWKRKIAERRKTALNTEKEESYAEAYRVMMNRFTSDDNNEQKQLE